MNDRSTDLARVLEILARRATLARDLPPAVSFALAQAEVSGLATAQRIGPHGGEDGHTTYKWSITPLGKRWLKTRQGYQLKELRHGKRSRISNANP